MSTLEPSEQELAEDNPTLRATLKRASVRGVAINFSAQAMKFIVQFIYQIVIMRLLLPDDFGLVAMSAPILAFVQMFTDFGLSQAVVQRERINQSQLSFLFWFSTAVSGVLSLLTIALAPLAGMFYNEPKVVQIIVALGALLFLSGLQSQPSALLTRRMEYGRLASASLASLVIGSAVGIMSALWGAGYWSLVYNQAATSFVSLAMIWVFVRWRPNRPAKVSGIRDLIGFGGNVTGFNVVNFFARNLDNVLIGKAWGGSALGLYDRAYKLLLLPLSQIVGPVASVALPMLSRTLNEPKVYRRAFLRMLETIILFTYPGIIFAICTSHLLIEIVFGARWEGVAPIFSILGIGGLMAPVGNATGWLFTSQNRTGEMRNWGILSSAIFVISFFIGLPWGPIGVATSYISFGMIQGPLIWWVSTRRGPVSTKDLFGTLLPFIGAGAVTLVTTTIMQHMLPETCWALIVMLIVAYAVFVSILACLPHGRTLFRELWEQRHHLTRRKT